MDNSTTSLDTQILHQISGLLIPEALTALTGTFPGRVTFSTSFSLEDQVITHHILSASIPVSIFTLDTGRLFAETYSVWSATNERYGATITAYYPDRTQLEPWLNTHGPNAFYESVANRKSCCHIRKVEPLQRALKGQAVWVTGLRAEHSPDRKDHRILERDEANGVYQIQPFAALGYRCRKGLYRPS